jgi:replicative DNA helicase
MENINSVVKTVEHRLLCAILNDQDKIEDAILKLAPQDFSDKHLAVIFGTIINLQKEAKKINVHNIIGYIDAHKELQFDDYDVYVKSLFNDFVPSTDVEDNIDFIKNSSIDRQMKGFASDLMETKLDPIEYSSKIDKLSRQFQNIVSSKHVGKVANMQEITKNYKESLNTLLSNSNNVAGTSSGFRQIDTKIGGFRDGDLVVLAARPGIGKTTLALNFLMNAAKEINQRKKQDSSNNEVVLMFSIEMGANEICNRLIAMESKVDLSTYKMNKLSDMEISLVNDAIDTISELPILIDDDSSLTIMDLQAKVKQVSLKHKIKLVVIDYLQFIKSPTTSSHSSRYLEISDFTRRLKTGVARGLNVPVVLLCQLNRNIEQRKGENPKPQLSDLRDSGSIEQDADVVSFLSRMSNVGDDAQENNQPKEKQFSFNDELMEYDIAKNRKGPTGSVPLRFIKN